MSGYSVDITYNDETQKALNGTYTLYAFKAVQSSATGGAPLVWFADSTFLADGVTVDWNESYQGFISTNQIIPNGQINTSAHANADLGETVTVDTSGNLSVSDNGDPDGITITNNSNTPYTCGIMQLQGSSMTPLCAFTLHGNQADDIVPIEKVLLFFGTKPVNTGTVIETTVTQGVLLDLTENHSVSVSYDIDGGWSAEGAAWATLVPPSTNMVPLLILES